MNTIRNSSGEVIGFRCFECGRIAHAMWGNTCNQCRAKHDEAEKLRNEIRLLREEVANIKSTK